MYGTVPNRRGLSNPFLFAITFTNLVCSQSQSSCRATLPQKVRRRCGASGKAKPFKGLFEPEDGFAARKAPSPIGVGRYGFYRTGVVMDWSNKSDEIYFNHFYYDKTTKTACFTRRTTPPQLAPTPPRTHKKKELKQCEYLSSRK